MDKNSPQPRNGASFTAEQLASGLGWFSIGLGLSELAAPGMIRKLIGLGDNHAATLRSFGLREIGSGIAILAQPRSANRVWTRVAGDVLDMAAVGAAMAEPNAKRLRLCAALTALAGVTALDIYCATELTRLEEEAGGDPARPICIRRSILVNRAPEDVYQYWRDLKNVPRFMRHVESVQETGEGKTHWRSRETNGGAYEWDAEITDERPNRLLSWSSSPSCEVPYHGSVRFSDGLGGRGTLVEVEMRCSEPSHSFRDKLAKVFGMNPGSDIEEELRTLKQIMETGEIPQSDASIHTGMHPAQPPAHPA